MSKKFYADLGFKIRPLGADLAQVSLGEHGFLLQNYYVAQWADNFMFHILVADLNCWWVISPRSIWLSATRCQVRGRRSSNRGD
jgi:hypothetical protein